MVLKSSHNTRKQINTTGGVQCTVYSEYFLVYTGLQIVNYVLYTARYSLFNVQKNPLYTL